jgi:ParB-like chromosome segregation protein Spo0J
MRSTTPLEVTYFRITSLKPDPRNPRVHRDKQVLQIAQSIESFGFNVPLLIDDEQKVIAGHWRLLAARKLGWDTIPAIRLGLTESQRMALTVRLIGAGMGLPLRGRTVMIEVVPAAEL